MQHTPYRVLLLAKYSDLGASSRVRCLQYIDQLAGRGIDVTVQPLINDDMLIKKYSHGSYGAIDNLAAYLNRLKWARKINDYEVIWIQKEIFPWFPQFFDLLFFKEGPRYVFDLDDAEYYKYQNLGWPLSLFLGKKFQRIIDSTDHVVVGNDYLKKGVINLNCPEEKISVVPSVVNMDTYDGKTDYEVNDKFILGWMGSPSTQSYLNMVIRSLESSDLSDKIHLNIIGGNIEPETRMTFTMMPWKLESEVSELKKFDVGVMPLDDSEFERGKCGYKSIQYMACGVPVVVSPVGVNSEIVEHGVSGFHARSNEEWAKYIGMLFHDRELRKRFGETGRRVVQARYSLYSQIEGLAHILKP